MAIYILAASNLACCAVFRLLFPHPSRKRLAGTVITSFKKKKPTANENNRNESFYRLGTRMLHGELAYHLKPQVVKILPGDLAPKLPTTVWEPQSSCRALNVIEGAWDTQEKKWTRKSVRIQCMRGALCHVPGHAARAETRVSGVSTPMYLCSSRSTSVSSSVAPWLTTALCQTATTTHPYWEAERPKCSLKYMWYRSLRGRWKKCST